MIGMQHSSSFLGLPPGDGHGKGVDNQVAILTGGRMLAGHATWRARCR
jgi:hypothetical protein